MTPAGPSAPSLDDKVLLPLLERVSRGTITVRHDEYGWPWYHDAGQHCPFATYLLEKLTEQSYLRWDSMVGEPTKLRVRHDGKWSVRLDYKGEELIQRVREKARSAESPPSGE